MNTITQWMEQAQDASLLVQLLSTFLVAAIPFLEAYVAVPLAIAVGFPALLAIVAGIVGNWLSVAAVVAVSGRLQAWMNRRQGGTDGNGKRLQRARRLFAKYGVPGVAFIGPLLVGNHIGSFISVVSGADKRYVMLWQTISIIVWAVGTGLLFYWGFDLFGRRL